MVSGKPGESESGKLLRPLVLSCLLTLVRRRSQGRPRLTPNTDEHVLSCPGYADIVMGKVNYDMFWDNTILNDMDKMSEIADVCVAVLERMEQIQNLELVSSVV